MFDHCLYFNTVALARRLEREWHAAFKAYGLTPSQAFLLRAVLDQPGLLQRELAAHLAIARPTVTRLLDGLADKGLVERLGTENDGREYAIHPTAAGREMQAALNEASGKVTQRLKKKLGVGAFTQTVGQVRGVRSALE